MQVASCDAMIELRQSPLAANLVPLFSSSSRNDANNRCVRSAFGWEFAKVTGGVSEGTREKKETSTHDSPESHVPLCNMRSTCR